MDAPADPTELPALAPDSLTQRVKALALAVGFDLAGVARAEPTRETEYFRDWLALGYDGEMAYLGRRAEERVDPRRVLEGARSVLAVALVYDPGPRPSRPHRSGTSSYSRAADVA